MSPLEHEQLRARFQGLDEGNSGRIPVERLCHLLRGALASGRLASADPAAEPTGDAAEVEWSSGELAELDASVRSVDSDRSGYIDFTEFLAAMMDPRLEDRPDLAHAAFRRFDRDGDGTLGRKDLAFVFDGLPTAERMVRLGDEDGDGELSFEEFIGLLRLG
mmetsp:Transcript_159213/g.510733  ORF Transcript_159213/g.510733 Transcript_159213/m.510733 type:complete len:162 (-) Transcript_159213:419-904(-)